MNTWGRKRRRSIPIDLDEEPLQTQQQVLKSVARQRSDKRKCNAKEKMREMKEPKELREMTRKMMWIERHEGGAVSTP